MPGGVAAPDLDAVVDASRLCRLTARGSTVRSADRDFSAALGHWKLIPRAPSSIAPAGFVWQGLFLTSVDMPPATGEATLLVLFGRTELRKRPRFRGYLLTPRGIKRYWNPLSSVGLLSLPDRLRSRLLP